MPNEDLDRPGHPQSDQIQSLQDTLWVAKDTKHFQMDSKDLDQPAGMCTCNLVGNAISRFISCYTQWHCPNSVIPASTQKMS